MEGDSVKVEEEFHDVDVIDVAGLDAELSGPFVVVRVDGTLLESMSEEAACRYQRAHRLSMGRDALTGEPLGKGKGSLGVLYALWDELAAVPVSGDGVIGEPFLHFTAGETEREAIWGWFEAQNEDFVVGEVLQGHRRDSSLQGA